MKRLTEADVRAIFAHPNVTITGSHFVYSKPTDRGDHSDEYVNKDAIYPNVRVVSALCFEMAHRVVEAIGHAPECVIGPEKGGIILSQWLAHWLNEEYPPGEGDPDTFAVYAEKKQGGGFDLRRGYDALVKGKHAIVVEDMLNTGGSVKEVIDASRRAGAEVLGVIALSTRGDVTAESLGVPYLHALLSMPCLRKYPEGECPICKEGVIPVRTDLGHGKDFLKRKAARISAT
jgi:orotate phosphoribosyltransferase